jgi:hypothetical protein
VAVHEAGYVVAWMVLGLPAFRYVTVYACAGAPGRVVVWRTRSLGALGGAVVAVAGEVAKSFEQWEPEQVHEQNDDGCIFADYLAGTRLAGHVHGDYTASRTCRTTSWARQR